MKKNHFIITSLLSISLGLQGFAAPVISHEPVNTAATNAPITILANVDDPASKIKSVFLHFTPSRNASPNKVVMTSTGVGAYYGVIPKQFISGKLQLFYYVEAISESGEWAETPWHTLDVKSTTAGSRVVNTVPVAGAASTESQTHTETKSREVGQPRTTQQPAERPPQYPAYPAEEEDGITDSKWFWPALIGGVVVVGAVALSGGGGGGGGNPDTTPATPAGPSEGSITQRASRNVTSTNLSFPQDTLITPTGLANRSITGGQVTLNFNPADGFAEDFGIFANGQRLYRSGPVTDPGQAVAQFDGDPGSVGISVISSTASDSGEFKYAWDATVFFFVEVAE